MTADPTVAERFEANRTRLRALAYRMLGSTSEADDAVQEAWLRLQHAGAGKVNNLGGWLTTVVARLCLDMLRERAARHEELIGVRLPEPVVTRERAPDPEQEALVAGAVGLALLVVLDTLAPNTSVREQLSRTLSVATATYNQALSAHRILARAMLNGSAPDAHGTARHSLRRSARYQITRREPWLSGNAARAATALPRQTPPPTSSHTKERLP